MFPILALVVFLASRSWKLVVFVMACIGFLAFVDHYDHAMQTLAVIYVYAVLCVLLGVPIGIAISRSDSLQRMMIPVLDMLQTLPPFVYFIPLILSIFHYGTEAIRRSDYPVCHCAGDSTD